MWRQFSQQYCWGLSCFGMWHCCVLGQFFLVFEESCCLRLCLACSSIQPACVCTWFLKPICLYGQTHVYRWGCLVSELVSDSACSCTVSWLLEWPYGHQICHNRGSGFWRFWYGLLNSLFLLCCLWPLNSSAAETPSVLLATGLLLPHRHRNKICVQGCAHWPQAHRTYLKQTGNHPPSDVVSHPRRTESLSFIIIYWD